MSHLSAERLAALADEIAPAEELAHLAGCAECARERAAYRELGAAAAASGAALDEPLTNWETLAPALEADGVLRSPGHRVLRLRHTSRPWLQVAAGVLLTTGGAVAGRWSAGNSWLRVSDVLRGSSAPAAPVSARAASGATPSADTAVHFASVEQARAAQTQYQMMYQAATTFLAQNDSSGAAAPDTPAAMRTRLAALDRVRETMGEALERAPYDPVINGYYLTTLGQREATLRQLNTVLPEGVRITSY